MSLSSKFFAPLVLAVAVLLSPPPEASAEFTDSEVESSVARATAFLLSQQEEQWGFFKPEDNWGNWGRRNPNDRFIPPRHSSALTALSIMGLASVGHMPTDPTPEGRAMDKALNYILMEDLADGDGYYGRHDHSQMYGHGIVSLMLAEMIGMASSEEQDDKIRKTLTKCVRVIVSSQKSNKSSQHKGGWRYNTDSRDSDISVTVWQLMALRAAKNAGIEVPKESIDDAVEYLKRCYTGKGKPLDTDKGHAFSYEAGKNHGSASTTAAGLLSLQVSGQYKIEEVEGSSQYLLTRPPKHKSSWFFYAVYYYSQGMYQRGDNHSEVAKDHTRDLLLPIQREDGSWLAENGSEKKVGRIYSTSLALLSLSVQHQFLPIYQR